MTRQKSCAIVILASGQTVAPKGLTGCPPTTEYGEPDRFRSIAVTCPAVSIPGGKGRDKRTDEVGGLVTIYPQPV